MSTCMCKSTLRLLWEAGARVQRPHVSLLSRQEVVGWREEDDGGTLRGPSTKAQC